MRRSAITPGIVCLKAVFCRQERAAVDLSRPPHARDPSEFPDVYTYSVAATRIFAWATRLQNRHGRNRADLRKVWRIAIPRRVS
jgi:hypothetical protein